MSSQGRLDRRCVQVLCRSVHRMKCSLSWALVALMFAVTLVPAGEITVVHSHDDEHASHHTGLLNLSDASHVDDLHPGELHPHRIGGSQMQQVSVQREVGAPVLLVAQVWLNFLVPTAWAERSTRLLRPSAESKVVHAPPLLLRSMAFLI